MRRPAHSNSADVAPLALHAGPLELFFDPGPAFIRKIRWQGKEVLRAIYGAVRDRNWQTIRPRLSQFSLRPGRAGFSLTFHAVCRNEDVHFEWDARITGTAKGEVRFEFNGEARRDFWRNRVGLCVLHPIAGCAGERCRVTHTDGTRTASVFPELISPHQPFLDIRSLRQHIAPKVFAETIFEGEVFEMEDQRNWTDTSFKTYSTPLARPFPVLLKAGTRIEQAVTFRLLDQRPARRTLPRRVVRSSQSDTVGVSVDFEHLRPKPDLGFGLPADNHPPSDRALDYLRALRHPRLRVDCHLAKPGWQERLTRAAKYAKDLHGFLQVAIYLSGKPRPQLVALHDLCKKTQIYPTQWLVFSEGKKVTEPPQIALARKILGPLWSRGTFAAGTDFNFAELNRARRLTSEQWAHCFSINPQVHSSDDLSLMENLDAQGDTIRSAWEFGVLPVISPITLLPRQNPDATNHKTIENPLPADPRQKTWFGAAWTLGSLATIAGMRVHSVTYFETTGPRGLMDISPRIELFPAYHVFVGFAEMFRLVRVEMLGVEAGQRIAGFAGITSAGKRVLWLANLTAGPQRVELHFQSRFRAVATVLGEKNAAGLARDPEAWWRRNRPRVLLTRQPSLRLPGYALARVDLEVAS